MCSMFSKFVTVSVTVPETGVVLQQAWSGSQWIVWDILLFQEHLRCY